MSLTATTSQTVGPFFHLGLAPLFNPVIAGPRVSGTRVTVHGRVLDADGRPVSDAMIEVWQANSHGKYSHPDDNQDKQAEPGFIGFGRVPTDDEGRYQFTTVKPGPVPGPGGTLQAPHLLISVFMRGILKRLVSRVYFPGDPSNTGDRVLQSVPVERRATLIAQRSAVDESMLEWNVILRGEQETVFFDC